MAHFGIPLYAMCMNLIVLMFVEMDGLVFERVYDVLSGDIFESYDNVSPMYCAQLCDRYCNCIAIQNTGNTCSLYQSVSSTVPSSDSNLRTYKVSLIKLACSLKP